MTKELDVLQPDQPKMIALKEEEDKLKLEVHSKDNELLYGVFRGGEVYLPHKGTLASYVTPRPVINSLLNVLNNAPVGARVVFWMTEKNEWRWSDYGSVV